MNQRITTKECPNGLAAKNGDNRPLLVKIVTDDDTVQSISLGERRSNDKVHWFARLSRGGLAWLAQQMRNEEGEQPA